MNERFPSQTRRIMDFLDSESVNGLSTTDRNSNFDVGINAPVVSSSGSVQPTQVFEPTASPSSLDELFSNSSRKKSNDSASRSDPSNLSLPGPSSSSNLPGPSTSFTGFDGVDSTDVSDGLHSFRCLFSNTDPLGLFLESPEIRRQTDSVRRNTMNETDIPTSNLLVSSPDMDNDDNNTFELNSPGNAEYDSRSNRGLTTSDHSLDQLFAPGDSSSDSSGGSSPDPRNSVQSQPTHSRFLPSRQSSSEDYCPPRNRYRRLFRPQLSLDFRDRDSESSLRVGSQRLSYLRTRLVNPRFRMRLSHADVFSRHKTTAALNVMTSTNDEILSSYRSGNDLRELNARPYRRNLGLKFHPESRFPLECDSSVRSHRMTRPDRTFINSRTSILRGIVDFENNYRSRPSTSNVRARSVSPTSASPNIPASVHDEPLDDIGINLRSVDFHAPSSEFSNVTPEGVISRPSSPLPPVQSPSLSDDGMVMVPLTSIESGSTTLSQLGKPQRKPASCQSLNRSMNATEQRGAVKEVPHTYDDLNGELIQLLECPICFEYTTPPINQCLQGHIICSNCRQRVTNCPTCRTMFHESRNLVMEKVAALLRYPCKNAITGCMEFLYLLQKEQHEMSCGFRQYACFLPVCKWRGYKPELLVHVQDAHHSHVIHGPSANLLIPASGQTRKVWLMTAFNELFYVIFFTTLGILKGCVRFVGDNSKCENYTYNISVTSEEHMMRTFNFTRTTHAYDENFENTELVDSYDLFSISQAQLHLFRKGTKAPVRITIEEAQKRTGSTASTPAKIN